MFAKPYLYPFFLSLFICSVSLAMWDPTKVSENSIGADFRIINLKYNDYHRTQGEYSKPEEINSELYNQIIETAPARVKLLVRGLIKNREEDLKLSCLKNALLHGESGNGKTELAKAMGITGLGKYYYMPAHYALSSCDSCRKQFGSEIDHLIQKKEPIAVIWDNIICSSSDLYRYAFLASLLEQCKRKAPFLFIIAITSNEVGDFPDMLTRRFESNKIYIPHPNLSSRNQIVSYYLNKKEHTLTTHDIAELAERLDDRTCRNIKKIVDASAAFSLLTNKIITLKEIKHAEEESPYEPSKYELLAQKFDMPREKARELWSIRHILKKEHTLLQYHYLTLIYTLQKIRLGQTAEVTEFEQKFNTILTIDEKTNADQIVKQLDATKFLYDVEEYMTQKDAQNKFGYTK